MNKLCLTLAVAALTSVAAQAQFTFAPAQTISVGERPGGLGYADLDGNGHTDLAVPVDNPDRIQILFNSGNATFGSPVSIHTGSGSSPNSVVAADMNNDGHPDLVVTLKNVHRVLILTNNGSGGFTATASIPVGPEPRGLMVADLTGNGHQDVVAVNRDYNMISFVYNLGANEFSVATMPIGNEPRAAVAGDLNGDTVPDLVVTSHDDRRIYVLFGNGNGTFGTPIPYSVGSSVRPEGVALGDVSGDGHLDIVVATGSSSGQGYAAIFTNNGSGTFSGPINLSTGGADSGSVIVADLDNDSLIDIAVANEDSNNISVFRNLGGMSFSSPMLLTTGTTPEYLAVGDFAGNGYGDLVTSNRDSNNLTVYTNNSGFQIIAESFTLFRGILASGGLSDLQASDNSYLVARPGLVLGSAEDPIQLIVEGFAPVANTTRVTLTVEAHASATNIRQRIYLFNFAANSYEEVDSRMATTTDSVVQLVLTNNPSRFIEPGTNRIRVRVNYRQTGPVLGFPWFARIDQVKWSIAAN